MVITEPAVVSTGLFFLGFEIIYSGNKRACVFLKYTKIEQAKERLCWQGASEEYRDKSFHFRVSCILSQLSCKRYRKTILFPSHYSYI